MDGRTLMAAAAILIVVAILAVVALLATKGPGNGMAASGNAANLTTAAGTINTTSNTIRIPPTLQGECPIMPADPNKTVVLSYANMSASSNSLGLCAKIALKIYYSKGILKKYNITYTQQMRLS